MLKHLFKVVFSMICVLSFGLGEAKAVHANIEISGTITDAGTTQALIGCSVAEKGTTNGVFTDADGNFKIRVKDESAILVVTFIGFETKEILVGSNRNINLSLSPTAASLNELVVIGYGSTSSKDVTGSVKSIKSESFNKGIINSPEQLLQGKVAGVNITAASGEPGSPLNINVRGPGGIRSGSTPLFVIDGFALDNSGSGGALNPLTFLNPEDIAAIDVLKDASATAIYGARGANGVILITTKKGKSGTSNLNYTTSVGISTIARPIEVFSGDEFRAELKELKVDFVDGGANTNWQKEITRQAVTQNHNLSLSGGSNKLTYFGSFGVQMQQGILKGSELNRYNARVNLNQKLWEDRLSIEVNLSAANTKNERPPIQSMIGGALVANPTYKAYDATGKPAVYKDGTNPLLILDLQDDVTSTNRILGNISPSLTLFKGLVYKLNFGIDYTNTQRDLQTLPFAEPLQLGSYENVNTNNTNRLIENYLTYSFQRNKISATALAGHSYQRIYLQGRGFSINKFPQNGIDPMYNPGLGQDLTLANNKPTGYAVINELQSYFSRVNFQYADKYLATATVRIDGSSKFGANNKYGVFPSFSFGWRLSEEEFLKNSAFSDLKLRAGWGLTGNQEIPSKITQALFTSSVNSTSSYPLTQSDVYPAGTTYSRLANPNIQWEVSSQADFGLDFSLFSGSLSGTVDYFNKVSKDILLEVIPADPVQPAGTYWTNVADMRIKNQGLELDINYRKNVSNKFSYEIGGNITFIKNKVTNSPYSVIPSGSASGSGLTSATINGYLNNQPIGTFFLKEFIGFDDKGISKYKDTDGDGIEGDNDRIAAGTSLPNRIFNLNGTVHFSGFDFTANFNGVSGNKVYDNTANANFYKLRLSKGLNTTAEAVMYPEESLSNSAPISTRFLKDGAFFRLNNAVLGYNVDTKKLKISKYVPTLRLSVTGQNLFLISKYNGYDPDVNTDRSINGVLSYGIDYLTYPKAKSFIFGLNVGL
jgi:TonB-dependent starch-binding outer membrane protein SusC